MKAPTPKDVPPELQRKLSSDLYMMVVENGRFLVWFGMGLSVMTLYGPVVGTGDHNALRYLLGPWVGPGVVAAYRTFVPFRPYRGSPFGRVQAVDARDPVVMRLVSLYRSSEAVQRLWKQALKLSGVLFVIMGILALLARNSLSWSFPYSLDGTVASDTSRYWFWMGWTGGCLGSFVALMADHISWGVVTWARRETAADTGGGSSD